MLLVWQLNLASAGSPDVTVGLSGQAVTASAGTLAPTRTVALSGQAVTASAGTIVTVGDVTLTLSGQSVTVSVGTLSPTTSKALTGSAVTASAGTLTPSRSIALSGQAVTVSSGTLSFAANQTIALTGQAVSALAGTLTANVPDVFLETIPYVIGATEAPATYALRSVYMTVTVSGSGGTVTAQSVDAFTRQVRGTAVTITMGGPVNTAPKARRPSYGSPEG